MMYEGDRCARHYQRQLTSFLGIMNLRGQIISIVDVRLKFGVVNDTEETTVVILIEWWSY